MHDNSLSLQEKKQKFWYSKTSTPSCVQKCFQKFQENSRRSAPGNSSNTLNCRGNGLNSWWMLAYVIFPLQLLYSWTWLKKHYLLKFLYKVSHQYVPPFKIVSNLNTQNFNVWLLDTQHKCHLKYSWVMDKHTR